MGITRGSFRNKIRSQGIVIEQVVSGWIFNKILDQALDSTGKIESNSTALVNRPIESLIALLTGIGMPIAFNFLRKEEQK